MTDDTSRVPKLRFPGFAGAWEQRKLGDLGLNISDGDWIEKQHIFENGQYRIIQTGNIGVDEYLDKPQNAKYFRKEDFNQLKANEIFPGDIVVCRLADPAGRAVILPNIGKQMVTSVDVAILRPSSRISFRFLVSQLNNPRNLKQVQIMASGSTRTRISRKNLEREIIQLPNINEQKKIGIFFSILNSTIALHQRKLSHLRQLKKGLLQKMFPKSGEDRPEVRFPGFVDAWEQRKLGDIADVVGGGTPDTGNPDYWNGDIDWYAPAEIGESVFVSESQRKITTLGLRKSSAKMLPPGTILFTSRAGIGNTAILAVSACTNQGFQSIVPHPEVADSYFIFARSSQLKRYGEKVGAGSTFVEVSGKQMSKMPLRVPVLQEQCRIGTLFRQIDDLITLHQRKLSHLQQQKKALLQQMLV